MITADVLLSNKVCGVQRREVLRIHRRKDFADQRQRTRVPPPRLRATGGVAPHRKRRTTLCEVAGIFSFLGDAPCSRQAYTVRVQQTSKAFSIETPAQIGS